MTMTCRVNLVLIGVFAGTIAHASPPLHPGAGSAILAEWKKTPAAEASHQSDSVTDGAYGSNDRDWQPADWIVARFENEPIFGDSGSSGGDSDVMRRAREVQQEAHERWYGRRVETDTVLGGEWYPEEAGWVSPEGKLDASKLPWWMF